MKNFSVLLIAVVTMLCWLQNGLADRLPKDQKQLIKSTMGNIIFTFRRSVDDRSSGDNRADCANGNVVSIP